MAGNDGKFLTIDVNGNIEEILAINSSAGAADASKIIRTDSGGLIDPSFLPSTNRVAVTAGENVTQGDALNLYNDGGALRVRRADASTSNAGRRCDGFASATVTSGNALFLITSGVVTRTTHGITIGAAVFLSTAGGVSASPATTSGHIAQRIGVAYDANTITVALGPTIERA